MRISSNSAFAALLLLAGCAEESKIKLPSDEELKASIKNDQKLQLAAAESYSNCASDYAEKMFRSNASAGDIADGAGGSCHEFADQYAIWTSLYNSHTRTLYRAGYSAAEYEYKMSTAPTPEQIAGQLIAQDRPHLIDFVLKLRGKVAGH